LKNWLNPNIGDLPLGSIGNLALKNLGATMVKGAWGLGDTALHQRGEDGCRFGAQRRRRSSISTQVEP
jgi:hypothetical protein